MAEILKERKTLSLKRPIVSNIVMLEYRLIWNEKSLEWDIYRNGVKTGLARRKKQSAIDMAILSVQSEEEVLRKNGKVVSMKDRMLTVEWTQNGTAAITA